MQNSIDTTVNAESTVSMVEPELDLSAFVRQTDKAPNLAGQSKARLAGEMSAKTAKASALGSIKVLFIGDFHLRAGYTGTKATKGVLFVAEHPSQYAVNGIDSAGYGEVVDYLAVRPDGTLETERVRVAMPVTIGVDAKTGKPITAKLSLQQVYGLAKSRRSGKTAPKTIEDWKRNAGL